MSEPRLQATDLVSHTPGPWSIGDTADTELMVYCDDALGSRVANCQDSGHGITRDQDHANARLIAAAPELLALARQYASECAQCGGSGENIHARGPAPEDEYSKPCEDCADIRTVIAKAEGKL